MVWRKDKRGTGVLNDGVSRNWLMDGRWSMYQSTKSVGDSRVLDVKFKVVVTD
jgi:hypothetical protein